MSEIANMNNSQTVKSDSTKPVSKLDISKETLQSAVEELMKDAVRYQKAVALKGKGDESAFEVPHTNIYVQFTLKTPPKKEKLRPIAIPLKHTLANEDDDVILFVKDPQREMKDYLEEHGNGGVTRVLGVEKLRKRYGTHEGRRELMNLYDKFLVDARVAPMMSRLLGKAFLDSKNMPLSVDTRHDVTAAIKRALSSTQFCPRRGTSFSITVGRPDFTAEQIIENIEEVLQKVVPKLEGGWKNVQSLNVKTNKSPALPIYVMLPPVANKKKRASTSEGETPTASKRQKVESAKTEDNNEEEVKETTDQLKDEESKDDENSNTNDQSEEDDKENEIIESDGDDKSKAKSPEVEPLKDVTQRSSIKSANSNRGDQVKRKNSKGRKVTFDKLQSQNENDSTPLSAKKGKSLRRSTPRKLSKQTSPKRTKSVRSA